MKTRSMACYYTANPSIDPVLQEAFRNSPCIQHGFHLVYPNQFKDELKYEVYYHFANNFKELQQIWMFLRGNCPVSADVIVSQMIESSNDPRWPLSTTRLHSYIAEHIRRLLHISIKIGSVITVPPPEL